MKRKFKRNDRVRLLIPDKRLQMGTVLSGFFNDAVFIYVVHLDDGFDSPVHGENINRAVFWEGILEKIPKGIDSIGALLLHDLNKNTMHHVAKAPLKSSPFLGAIKGGKFPANAGETRRGVK